MSNSYRKPYHRLNNQIDKKKAHRQVRKRVKQELTKEEPDEFILEADTRDLGLEEWGTKYGFDTTEIYDDDDDFDRNEKIKLSRK